MSVQPSISLIVPIANAEQFRSFLAENDPFLTSREIEVIGVHSDFEEFAHASRGSVAGNVKHCLLEECAKSRSMALNVGAYVSSSSRLLFVDDSIVFMSDLPGAAMSLVDESRYLTAETIRTVDQLKLPDSSLLREVIRTTRLQVSWSDGTNADIVYLASDLLSGHRAGYSILGITEACFGLVGGYDSGLLEAGWEDADIRLRAESNLGLKGVAVGECKERIVGEGLSKFRRQGVNNTDAHFTHLLDRYRMGGRLGTYHQDVSQYKNQIRILP